MNNELYESKGCHTLGTSRLNVKHKAWERNLPEARADCVECTCTSLVPAS